MPQRDQSNPSQPWEFPVGHEAPVDLLYRLARPPAAREPIEDLLLQQIEKHYNLKMPSMWAEQAKAWSPELRFHILVEVAVIKRDCQPLLDLGADPDFVVQVVSALRSDPFLRYALTVLRHVTPEQWVETSGMNQKLAYMRRELEGWTNNPIFPELPPDTQACIRRALTDAITQHERLMMPFMELRRQAAAKDPLLPFLERSRSTGRGRGRPSQLSATLFMVLLTDHLRAQTKRPHSGKVGQVAEKLFPGCFAKHIRTNPNKLRPAVQDRCKKFKKDLGAHMQVLQAVIFTNPTR
jgi:hypothetical protein